TFYTVNFYDESGNQLLQTGTIKPGERAVPPTEVPVIENMEFIGWVDITTNQAVNLNNVSCNLNLKAKYENVSYDVVFTHGDGSTETIKLSRTQSVDESVFPTPKQMDGYTFTNWVSVGTNVYRANYIKNQYDITFKYRSYANNAYSSDIITKTVKYNYDALKIEEISGAKCDGISKNNDFHFIYWYTLNYNNEKVKVEFPYITEKGMYEITFYAEYVDFNVGSEGLVYQEYNDGLIITDYQGNDDIVVIPKKAALAGQRKDVIDIKDGIFKDKNIKEFIVDNDNPYFVSEGGVLYKYSINDEEEKNKDILVLYPNMVESTSFTMANTILDIGPYAFANNKYLTEVNLSTSLISISDYAFYNCTKLTSIVMPANLTKIETGAFYMEEASNLETINFSGIELEFINNYAFSGCDKLKTFTLPSSLKQIGVAVFKDCYSLTEINCDKNSYFSSFNGGLYSADFSILYAQPAYYNNGEYNIVINEECKTIYSGAFSKSKAITITIESDNLVFEPGSFNMDNLLAVIYTKKASIDDVGNFANMFNQAFGYRLPKHVYVENSIYDQFETIQLEDVVISSYDSLNLGYGYSNNYLYEINGNSVSIVGYVGTDTELTIANTIGDYNINKISEYAFAYNPYIQKVTIPVGIESIGEYAFQNCINLEEIVLSETSASLLKRIESYAFLDSTRLTRVIASDDFTLDYLGRYAFNGTNYYENASSSIILGGMYIKYIGHDSEYIIPSNVTYIVSDAFKDAGTIVTLSFESSSRIKTIDSYAFMNCVGLTSITFPVSLKTIDSYAFYGCSYLYSVTFNDNQANINVDKDAFYGAGSYYDEGSVYQVFKDSQQYILTFQTTATAVDTDTGIAFVKGRDPKDLTTTQLFMGWYYDENNTQIVKFPIRIDKDTTIYAKVEESTYSSSGFSYDSTIDSNNEFSYKITGYSGNDSFVVVPEIYYDKKVISIGENVFGEEVQNIYIRATTDSFGKNISVVKHIGMGAFEKTYWYKNFPGDFVYYDNILIGYKGNATEVVIPDGITLLADGVFSGNTKITKVTFPSTIKRIPDYTFKNCTNLQTIVLSSSINSIGKEAFYGCTNLININFEVITNLNELSYDAFTNTSWLNNQNKDCIIINDILYKYVGSRSILHIPSQVTIIGDYAFAENNTIKNIYLTSAVSSINAYAFKDCSNLNSINFLSNENNSLISIQEGA
ncbi:MAG: leucine-rich repeat protein, partial [Clostridia bacterium]|nr:leucine-rich repeat protein [Clostridia bacterium]